MNAWSQELGRGWESWWRGLRQVSRPGSNTSDSPLPSDATHQQRGVPGFQRGARSRYESRGWAEGARTPDSGLEPASCACLLQAHRTGASGRESSDRHLLANCPNLISAFRVPPPAPPVSGGPGCLLAPLPRHPSSFLSFHSAPGSGPSLGLALEGAVRMDFLPPALPPAI